MPTGGDSMKRTLTPEMIEQMRQEIYETLTEPTTTHEQKVTSLINNLFALTAAENDYATQSMLKWFIDEQVEEEENAQTIIYNLKMIQGNGYGLFMLDKELGARTYTPASALTKN